MSDSKLLDYLNANYELAEKHSNERQRVFVLPDVMFGYLTFLPETHQINIHTREFRDSKSAVISFLLNAAPLLTSGECSKNIPLSFSWEKFLRKPEIYESRPARALLLDDVIEIGLETQHINSLLLPHVGTFGAIALNNTGRATGQESIKRVAIVNLINAIIDNDLNNYFSAGQTGASPSPDLPPPVELSFNKLYEGQRGNGLAIVLFDIIEKYQAILSPEREREEIPSVDNKEMRVSPQEGFQQCGRTINEPLATNAHGQKARWRIRFSQAFAALMGKTPEV